MSAFEWGRKAFETGAGFRDCPYPTGSIKCLDWRRGYMDAKLDADRIIYLKDMAR